MGNILGRADEDEEEAAEQKALEKWRPEVTGQVVTKKRLQTQHSHDDLGSQGEADNMSAASSVSQMEEEQEAVVDEELEEDEQEEEEKKSQQEGSHQGGGSESEDEFDAEAEAAAKRDEARKRKKIIVRMEFEPLLSLNEPLGTTLEEPTEVFSTGKSGKRNKRMEEAALEDAKAAYRAKSKTAAAWLNEMNLEDCLLAELSQGIGEDPDELRFALEQSKRFVVDDDHVVEKTMVQRVLDVMESDIETMTEILNKLGDATEADVRAAVKDSLGEFKVRVANDIELIERVDPEEEQRAKREEEKVMRMKEKMAKKKELQKRRKRSKKGGEEAEVEDSDSSDDLGGQDAAEKKALAFRRLQVQIKIEEFLKSYTRGQNLVKINARGKRYARRVYVDTAKRALVIQGANGPKFFPFAAMKEVDLETRTTKEGRVETLVICAIEKEGRIVKELTLAFPDQAKASTFVNSRSIKRCDVAVKIWWQHVCTPNGNTYLATTLPLAPPKEFTKAAALTSDDDMKTCPAVIAGCLGDERRGTWACTEPLRESQEPGFSPRQSSRRPSTIATKSNNMASARGTECNSDGSYGGCCCVQGVRGLRLNMSLKHLWPEMSEAGLCQPQVVGAITKQHIRRVELAVGTEAKFSEFTLGSQPVVLGPIQAHFSDFFQVSRMPRGSVRIRVLLETRQLGEASTHVKGRVHVQSSYFELAFSCIDPRIVGEMVLRVRPHIPDSPGTGSLSIFFVDPPKVDFTFSGNMSFGNFPFVKEAIRHSVDSLIAEMPGNLGVLELVSSEDLKMYPLVFSSPVPVGILRVTLEETILHSEKLDPSPEERAAGVAAAGLLTRILSPFAKARGSQPPGTPTWKPPRKEHPAESLQGAVIGVTTEPYMKQLGQQVWMPDFKPGAARNGGTTPCQEQHVKVSLWDRDLLSKDDLMGESVPIQAVKAGLRLVMSFCERFRWQPGDLHRCQIEFLVTSPGQNSTEGYLVVIRVREFLQARRFWVHR
eukprot:Skav228107  [mRNA]  locus=scaffold730:87521:130872:+ [translate_table: standard]